MNNLMTIQSYHTKIWDDKDLNAIAQFFSKNALIHSPLKTTQGTSEMKEIISLWHQGFPNLKLHWDDFICEGDKVVSRWHAKGQQEGCFFNWGPSTNTVNYSGMTIYQLENNKITEYWALVDMDTLKKQLNN